MANEGDGRAGYKPPPPWWPPASSGGGGGSAAVGLLASIQAAIPGIPAALASQMGEILAGDPTDAGMGRALALLRGSSWFSQTFVGYNQGVGSGLFSGDLLSGIVQYRQWRNSIRDNFNQNYGRDATVDELTNFATSGFDSNTVGEIGSGHALATANAGDWNYLSGAFDSRLSDQEKEAYGQLLAGRSSDLGLRVQQRIQNAMAKANALFSGVLAGQGGALPTPGLQKLPDVGA